MTASSREHSGVRFVGAIVCLSCACAPTPAATDAEAGDGSAEADGLAEQDDGMDEFQDDGGTDESSEDDVGCPLPDPAPLCPGGAISDAAMAPADRVLFMASHFGGASRAETTAFGCTLEGTCFVVRVTPELVACTVRTSDPVPEMTCVPLDSSGLLGPDVLCDRIGAAGVLGDRIQFFLDCTLDPPRSRIGWFGTCFSGAGDVNANLIVLPGLPDGNWRERLLSGVLAPAGGSLHLFGPAGQTADFRWADAGDCAADLRPGGVIIEWPTMAPFNDAYHDEFGIDRAAVAYDSGTVVMAALLDRIEEPDFRNRFIVVFSDLAGSMIGTPTYLTVDDMPYVDWNPRLALLDDGTLLVLQPGASAAFTAMSTEYW